MMWSLPTRARGSARARRVERQHGDGLFGGDRSMRRCTAFVLHVTLALVGTGCGAAAVGPATDGGSGSPPPTDTVVVPRIDGQLTVDSSSYRLVYAPGIF